MEGCIREEEERNFNHGRKYKNRGTRRNGNKGRRCNNGQRDVAKIKLQELQEWVRNKDLYIVNGNIGGLERRIYVYRNERQFDRLQIT